MTRWLAESALEVAGLPIAAHRRWARTVIVFLALVAPGSLTAVLVAQASERADRLAPILERILKDVTADLMPATSTTLPSDVDQGAPSIDRG